MQDSIFTKIIKGQIPSHKIYEDEKTLAILDIHPVQPGHVLVVPKAQVNEFQELDKADYDALFDTVRLVSLQLKETYPTKRVGLKIVGVDVPHAHVHLFPFSDVSEYNAKVNLEAEPDHFALAAVASKLQIKGEKNG